MNKSVKSRRWTFFLKGTCKKNLKNAISNLYDIFKLDVIEIYLIKTSATYWICFGLFKGDTKIYKDVLQKYLANFKVLKLEPIPYKSLFVQLQKNFGTVFEEESQRRSQKQTQSESYKHQLELGTWTLEYKQSSSK